MNTSNLDKKTDFAAMISMLFFASSATIIPICLVKITEDLSISLTEISLLNFIGSIELLLALLLSCYIAARFGKIKAIRLSLVIIASGLFLIYFCRTFWHILFVFLLLSCQTGRKNLFAKIRGKLPKLL